MEGGLADGAVVMSWRGEKGGIEAAEQEHPVVMSPNTYVYFDYYQAAKFSEPLAIGGYLPLSKVYEFSPIPKELDKKHQHYVLGGQANVLDRIYAQLQTRSIYGIPTIVGACRIGLDKRRTKELGEFLQKSGTDDATF